MIDGIIVSFAFIGLISVLFYCISCFYKTKGNYKCLIFITDSMSENDICNLVCGIYFKSIVFGADFSKNILLIDLLEDGVKKKYLSEISVDFSNIKVLTVKENDSFFV